MNIYKKRVVHDKNGHAYADKSINENFRLHTEESGIRIKSIESKNIRTEKNVFPTIAKQTQLSLPQTV